MPCLPETLELWTGVGLRALGVWEWSEGGETAAMEPPCLKLFVGQLLLELPQWEACDFSKEVTQ